VEKVVKFDVYLPNWFALAKKKREGEALGLKIFLW
jgi:hypothetical protein